MAAAARSTSLARALTTGSTSCALLCTVAKLLCSCCVCSLRRAESVLLLASEACCCACRQNYSLGVRDGCCLATSIPCIHEVCQCCQSCQFCLPACVCHAHMDVLCTWHSNTVDIHVKHASAMCHPAHRECPHHLECHISCTPMSALQLQCTAAGTVMMQEQQQAHDIY